MGALLLGGLPAAAQSTTTTVPVQAIDPTSTAADNPAQRTLLWIIAALVLLAVVVLVCTVVFWRRTRPRADGALDGALDGAESGEGTRVSAAELAARSRPEPVPVVRAASQDDLRSVPTWAEEPAPEAAEPDRPPGRRRQVR